MSHIHGKNGMLAEEADIPDIPGHRAESAESDAFACFTVFLGVLRGVSDGIIKKVTELRCNSTSSTTIFRPESPESDKSGVS